MRPTMRTSILLAAATSAAALIALPGQAFAAGAAGTSQVSVLHGVPGLSLIHI